MDYKIHVGQENIAANSSSFAWSNLEHVGQTTKFNLLKIFVLSINSIEIVYKVFLKSYIP